MMASRDSPLRLWGAMDEGPSICYAPEPVEMDARIESELWLETGGSREEA